MFCIVSIQKFGDYCMIQDYVKGKIRIYQRNIKRKLKDGSSKTYTSEQHQVTLDKNNMFEDGQSVGVMPLDLLIGIYEKLDNAEKDIMALADYTERYGNLQEQHQTLSNEVNQLRNKHDHLQERLRTALEEINQHEKVISDLSNRSFLDYAFGRLPESYKRLQAPKE